ncbi:unnamed protein product [Timema podura]|uniref:Protein kinase domain-containing protein n=1 Tax=Timema podura TaxID=61482 RepID=A0ABN7P8X9_TIMPD|nr:unnamed protein product [Timema podura]
MWNLNTLMREDLGVFSKLEISWMAENMLLKKICLRYRNVDYFLRNLREVKMLARLNHPNIVSYKAAWLEPLDRREASDYARSNIEEQFDSPLLLNPDFTAGLEQPGGGWVEFQGKPGQVQTRDRRLVRARPNTFGTGSGHLAPNLVGCEC